MTNNYLDTAQLELSNESNETLYFYRQFVDCFQCPLIQTAVIPPHGTPASVYLKTIYHQEFAISKLNAPYVVVNQQNEKCINWCSDSCSPIVLANLADQGKYKLRLSEIGDSRLCQLDTVEYGRNNLYSLVIVTFIYFLTILALQIGGRYLYKRFCSERRPAPDGLAAIDDSVNVAPGSPAPGQIFRNLNGGGSHGRFGSIDAFRGLTILLMIFVNYGAGEYHWLKHAPWDGLHLADVVFPFFVFIMGASIAVGFKSLTQRSTFSLRATFRRIVGRSVKLFLLGVVTNSIGSADFSNIRIPGVLQRFALSYFAVASVHLLSLVAPKRCTNNAFFQKLFRYFPLFPEYSLALVMSVLYGYFTFFWKYDENCPVGYVGPGGLYDNMYYPYCTGGAARKIDELLFTPQHSYKGFFGAVLYDPGRRLKLWHDPEGLLGTTTSVVLTLIGFQVGHILVYNHEPWARFRKWFITLIVLGALFKFSTLALAIPVNKNLWSFSFITVTGCMATAIFSLFHLVIDIRNYYCNWPEGWPLHYAGQNSILLYMGHEIAHDMLPFSFVVSGTLLSAGGHIGFLLRNLIGTTIWLLISVYLAKKQIFITL